MHDTWLLLTLDVPSVANQYVYEGTSVGKQDKDKKKKDKM